MGGSPAGGSIGSPSHFGVADLLIDVAKSRIGQNSLPPVEAPLSSVAFRNVREA
jgi:hypothetical protein